MSDDLTVPERGKRGSVVLEAGVRIGSYTLTGRQIGSGGFAHVYEATHPTLELRVAIKVQDARGDATLRARGTREAMVLARVQHRNVVQIFDAGELEDGRQYLAMELLTGNTLRDVLNEGTPSPAQALTFLRAIASALDAVHARGLVHRDLKPSNIFMCRDDDGEIYPKLIDFGIAKDLSLPDDRELTTSGSFIGTPAYMSPEQCLGKRTIDSRSDIYTLGVVAYQMLAGHPPFEGVVLEVAHAHAHSPVPSICGDGSRLPAALDAAFAKILAKDPDARPAAASDAIELVAEALASQHPGAAVVTAGSLAAKDISVRRRRLARLSVGAALALAVLGAVVGVWHGLASRQAPSHATADAPGASSVVGRNADAGAPSVQPSPVDATADASIPVDAPPDAAPRSRAHSPHRVSPPPSIDDTESLPAP